MTAPAFHAPRGPGRRGFRCRQFCSAAPLSRAAPVPKGDDNKSWVGKTVLPKKPWTSRLPRTAPADL